MAFPTKAKYVIIGAGIHGLSTAWHLAEKIKKNGNGSNNDIVVIDKGGISSGVGWSPISHPSTTMGSPCHLLVMSSA